MSAFLSASAGAFCAGSSLALPASMDNHTPCWHIHQDRCRARIGLRLDWHSSAFLTRPCAGDGHLGAPKAGKSESFRSAASKPSPALPALPTLSLAVLLLAMAGTPAGHAPAGGAGGVAGNPHAHAMSSHRSDDNRNMFALPGVASAALAGGAAPDQEPAGACMGRASSLWRCAPMLTQHLSLQRICAAAPSLPLPDAPPPPDRCARCGIQRSMHRRGLRIVVWSCALTISTAVAKCARAASGFAPTRERARVRRAPLRSRRSWGGRTRLRRQTHASAAHRLAPATMALLPRAMRLLRRHCRHQLPRLHLAAGLKARRCCALRSSATTTRPWLSVLLLRRSWA